MGPNHANHPLSAERRWPDRRCVRRIGRRGHQRQHHCRLLPRSYFRALGQTSPGPDSLAAARRLTEPVTVRVHDFHQLESRYSVVTTSVHSSFDVPVCPGDASCPPVPLSYLQSNSSRGANTAFQTRAPNTAALAMLCWPRRSSSGGTLSVWPSSAAPCHLAARYRRITGLWGKRVPSPSAIYSAISSLWSSTATCSALSALARAQCALPSSALGTAR